MSDTKMVVRCHLNAEGNLLASVDDLREALTHHAETHIRNDIIRENYMLFVNDVLGQLVEQGKGPVPSYIRQYPAKTKPVSVNVE